MSAQPTVQPTELDPFDVRIARGATGLLREFNVAGVLRAADVHVAVCLGRLGGDNDERVLLAAALAVRAVRLGSVCIGLDDARDTAAGDDETVVDVDALPWPDAASWAAAVAESPLVAVGRDGDPARPLRLVDGLFYLDRYWRQEEVVRQEMDERLGRPALAADAAALGTALDRLFPDPRSQRQRLAGELAATRAVTVLAGGPGTGKTTTVARLLDLLRTLLPTQGGQLRIALAAPTGKAAARLQEAVTRSAVDDGLDVGDVSASTLHRLLGWRRDSRSRFRHNRDLRLPYDVVVVDECSMVSLTMMSRLLEAVRPQARLVLVGDPDQLASVEAGAVLGDLVARAPDASRQVPGGVVQLTERFRFGAAIGQLADAIRGGDPDEVARLLRAGGDHVSFIETDVETHAPTGLAVVRADVVRAARELLSAARAGRAADALRHLDSHRLLCAHRRGPYGLARWTSEIERWLAADVAEWLADEQWYVGRPLLVTANDSDVDVYNGDTGVVVADPARGVTAAFSRGAAPVLINPSRLSSVQTAHAMTVHRSQGSQFATVTFVLPPPDSPLLTRELLYTAATRAERHVRVVGSEESVRRAVARPVRRASGLRRR